MKNKTKVLIVEHNKSDIELVLDELKSGEMDFDSKIVENEKDYCAAISNFNPDIILSDYSLPYFAGTDALKIREEIAPGTPFIFVSGSIGEEKSIEYIRNGVTDYVLKDKLFTLTVKVKRALTEANAKKEKNRTEQELVQSERLLARAQQIAHLGSWELCFSDNVFRLSAEGSRIFGVSNDQNKLPFDQWSGLIHLEDKESVLQSLKESRYSLRDAVYYYRIILKDGTVRHIFCECKPELDSNGNASGLYGIIQDVTERKKSEAAIKKAYEERNTVLERIDDGFFAVDKDSVVTYWNKKAEILLDMKKEDAIGRNLHELFAATASTAFYNHYQKALKEKTTVHFQEFSNRTNKWFAVSAFASDNGLSVYFKDVTDTKNSEDKLKESELRYRSIIDQATDVICMGDASMKITDINVFGCELLGYSKEEFLSLSITDLLMREDLQSNPLNIDELKAGKIIRSERRLKRKDGVLIDVELSARLLEDGRVIVFGHDIAKRKKADDKIKESELRYRSLNEQATDAICITDGMLKFIDINPYACETFGYTKEEALQLSLTDIFFDEDLVNNPVKLHELKLGRTIRNERRLKKKDGTAIDMEVSTKIMEDGRLIMFGHDITERKKIELLVRESEKQYRRIVETAQEGIWLIDKNNTTTFVNKKMADILEYTTTEMTGKENYFFMDDEWKKKAADDITNRKLGKNENHDFKYTTKSGKDVWTNLSTNPVFDDAGIYEGALAMVTDITARKKTEQEISWLINNTEESFILLNRNLEITSFNDRAKRLYSNYLLRELIKGTCILDYAQPHRYQKVKDIYDRVLGGLEETDEIVIQTDAGIKNFALKYKPAIDEQGTIIGVFVSAIDITERKKAEAQKEFERRDKEALINSTADLMWSVTSDFKLIAANNAFIASLKEFNGVDMRPGDELLMNDKFPKEYLVFWRNLYTKALTGNSHVEEIYFPRSEHQSEFWGEVKFSPIYDGTIITGIACYSRDTTASKNYKNKLIDINKKLKTAQQIASLGYWELDMNIHSLYWSDEMYTVWGVSAETFKTCPKNVYQAIHPDDKKRCDEAQMKALGGIEKLDLEYRILTPSGQVKYVHEKAELVYNEKGKAIRFEGTVQDVTQRKELENLLNRASRMARIGSWEVDFVKETLYWSDITQEIHETAPGFTPDLATAINFYKEGESRKTITKNIQDSISTGSAWDVELQIVTARGNERWVRSIGECEFANGKVVRLNGSFQDVDIRKRAELEVNEVLEEKNTILESIDDAFFAVDKNWKVTYWNSQAERVLERSKAEILNHNLWDVFSDRIDSESYKKYHEAMSAGHSVHFEDFYPLQAKWYEISAYPSSNGLSVYFKNISERKISEMRLNELNESLRKQAKELALSNAELEQFAYVASHDLQEPLRMVTSFLTQIEKKYGSVIDEKGKKYIAFAVDGARRMRQIILDLLEFSRVGRTEEDKENVDLNVLVKEIQILFRKQIQEKKAIITINELPVLCAHRVPLHQVFQNLVSNALKYTQPNNAAQVSVSAKECDTHWQFAVADNGIGIAQEYFDRIFIIFQRLHNKDEFSGTGMGLAVTKKIVENLGGKIWLESEEGKGSTFYFTIMK